ncbi:CPBP family intramembrane metalloprotease [Ancylomarina euxinus]|uniref:CPBP family intramembrane metalloprotease n=1 Tax=Ancylomarina euxinus TaxID=2283627 RepID=A0A425Y361_9BACT|nr:type II CAAX endopeptidase family protein [Ancylomarina euxinus]MCZ4693131.1 type II CAAX endopeptidase family protein [Ancylomarina euxinus]MUP15268.1 CPBP family intramembrane metalloprotease [Ancylomarina euxinus]RRG22602.1 CPBP family intramembrane metalloprotease [Ancylomarina euxinus]
MSDENPIVREEAKSNIPVAIRIILVILGTLFIGGLFSFIASLIISGSLDSLHQTQEMNLRELFFTQGAGLIGALAVIFFFRKNIDKRSISSMGFSIKGKSKDLLWGLLSATGIMLVGTGILYINNSISITSIHFDTSDFIYGFLLFIIVALNEEILCRGYILNNLMDSTNPYWSLIISSTIFTLGHSFNDNLSLFGITNLFIAGILLGSTYIYTRNLWFPISLHLFWNFIQGCVFDYNVSGLNVSSVFKFNILIKNSFNGGDFGFEGSWLCTLLSSITILVIIYYYKRQNTPAIRRQKAPLM